jgi:hypothetical protein
MQNGKWWDACDECGNLTVTILVAIGIALNVRGINEKRIQARMTVLILRSFTLPVVFFGSSAKKVLC